MKKLNLEEQEEKALVGILYNHISFGTTLEILGELKEEGIQRLDLLRSIFGKFPKVIKIGSRLVGEGQPTYFIADVGANFDNNLEKAKKLALAAKESGADVVKFQSFLSSKIVSGPSFAKMKLKGVHGSWGRT